MRLYRNTTTTRARIAYLPHKTPGKRQRLIWAGPVFAVLVVKDTTSAMVIDYRRTR